MRAVPHLAEFIHSGVTKGFGVLDLLRFWKKASGLRNEAIVYLPLMARLGMAGLHKLFGREEREKRVPALGSVGGCGDGGP